jgi:Spherulation-specific family 4/Domain of unknown function (DUF4214)
MLQGFNQSLHAAFRVSRVRTTRLARRTAPSLIALEHRVLLSVKGVHAPVSNAILPLAIRRETQAPEAAKANKQVKFVDSLYKTYYHHQPNSQQLSYVLGQLSSGKGKKAVTAEFKTATTKTFKKLNHANFVTALYATIAGEAATSVGQAYWQGLLSSGEKPATVERKFAASDGLLPAPSVSWPTPAPIYPGTPLGPNQLDATASVSGTFAYSPAAGTVLGVGDNQKLSVVFTPSDTADYPVVSDTVSINVTTQAPIPTPTPTPTPSPTPTPTPTGPPLGIIVPAYFAPGNGGPGGIGDGWAALTAAASKVSITAIFNPNSGPASSASPAYASAFTNLEAAGGKVVAYVTTENGNANGTTPLATVEKEITTYLTQYPGQIDGFMLDQMLVTPTTLPYYINIYSYIKSLSPSSTVIGNPGQPYLNGTTPAQYLAVADVFNIFEGTNASYASFPSGQTWYQSDPSDWFSNIVYDVPADSDNSSTSSAMQADVTFAVAQDTGFVYITNTSGGNPYQELPSYWNQEVATVAAH